MLKDKADLSEESSNGAGRFGESQLWGEWSFECGVIGQKAAQENRTRIDIHVGAPGRPGRGLRGGRGLELPFHMEPAGGGILAVPALGLRPGYAVPIQSCSIFSFVYLFSACECRREGKQSLGDSSMASQKGTFQFPFHSQNDERLCRFLPSHCHLGAVTPVLSVWFSFEYWDGFPV